MGKMIVVASGKGGTGKTTTVGAVASCLAVLGHKTLCVDCDAGLRNLDISIGMADYAVADFYDVLSGTVPFEQAVSEHPSIKGLWFLSAPPFRGPEEIDGDAMSELFTRLKGEFDYCLVDSPAGIGPGFRLASQCADMALVVVTCDMASIRDGQRVMEELRAMNIPEIRLVVNRVRQKDLGQLETTIDDAIDRVGAQLIGLVVEDENIFLAANTETPLILYENKKAARQFLDIARRISGESVSLSKKRP